MADTLEQLLASVGSFKAGAEDATQKVIAALSTQAALTSAGADVYRQQATDDVTIATAKNAADYATQLARVKAANALGTNLKDNSEVITSLATASADAYNRRVAALDKIAKKDKVTFLSNPLGYIANQFTINGDIAEHNIANAQMEMAQNRITAVNAATQTTIQTQNAITESLTAASMDASARNAAVAATINARNAEIQALTYGTKGIEFALNAKKDILALGFQANSALNAERQMAMSLARLEQDKLEFKMRVEQFNDHKAEKADQQAMGQ